MARDLVELAHLHYLPGMVRMVDEDFKHPDAAALARAGRGGEEVLHAVATDVALQIGAPGSTKWAVNLLPSLLAAGLDGGPIEDADAVCAVQVGQKAGE